MEHPVSRYTFDEDSTDGSSHGLMLALVGRDRDVLDVGCAAGDLARALRARGCRVTGIDVDAAAAEAARPDLDHLVVGDLEAMDLAESLEHRTFDVVVFGDVLEHLRDPLAVLRQVRGLLRPDGSVVLSIPNVAHASVRLSLLNGHFTYRDLGLLDETHLRFFTRESVLRLVADAGLVAVDVRRTVLGPFDSEIPLSREQVPEPVLAHVMSDPEAITYQFVLEAVVDDAAGRTRLREARAHADRQALDAACASVARLEQQLVTTAADHEQRLTAVRRAHAHQVQLRQAAELRAEELQDELDAQGSTATAAQADLVREVLQARQELAAHRASTSWRVSAPVRALGPLRTALQGPPGSRPSLRRAGAVGALSRSLRQQGVRGTVARVQAELDAGRGRGDYDTWVQDHGTLRPDDREAIARRISTHLDDGPLISVVMPVYETNPELLRAAVASVTEQLYPRWELCLVDDCSPSPHLSPLLAELAGQDSRIQVRRRAENGGIAATTNDALRMASGEFVAFVDHDDLLAPHALYLVAEELLQHPDTDLLYSDEDKLDRDGRRYDPHFKPDFDRELLLGQNYLSHLTVVRRTIVERLGGLDEQLDGAQDHDLALRAVEVVPHDRIRHLPWVLYHWRQWPGSGTFSSARLLEATAASRSAVAAHLERSGERDVKVLPCTAQPGWNVVLRRPSRPLQAVTAVVPTRDRLCLLRPCIEGLLDRTDYDALHVLVVDNDSSEPETLRYLEDIGLDDRVTVARSPGPFNYSRINNEAVQGVGTPLLLLLNSDVVVRDRDWLSEMVSLLEVPGTGAVGAKLLYGNGLVQHAGVILGIGGVAGHSHKHAPASSTGYFGRLVLNQTVSAATAACLLLRTSTYRDVGGLDEDHLAVAFNDVDLCLRIRSAGLRTTFAANAVLDHLESASRGAEQTAAQVSRFNAEADTMRSRWAEVLSADPAYNLNLTDTREDFSLAAHPRVQAPWR